MGSLETQITVSTVVVGSNHFRLEFLLKTDGGYPKEVYFLL